MSEAKSNDLAPIKEESKGSEAAPKKVQTRPQVQLVRPCISKHNQKNIKVTEAQICVPEKVVNTKRRQKSFKSRPLMKLLQQRISTANKDDMVISEEQILSILDKELNIDIDDLDDLEKALYMSIVQTLFKRWPDWKNFDQCVDRNLKTYYLNLKRFIKEKFDAIKPLAEDDIATMTAGLSKAERKLLQLF